MNEDMKRSLELTYKMIEEQYRENPEMAEQMKEMLEASITAYSGVQQNNDQAVEDQVVQIAPERMRQVSIDDIEGPLEWNMENEYELQYHRVLNDIEYTRITFGVRATDMDEKWNIIFDNDIVSFYRSWTGKLIFRFRIERVSDHYEINGFSASGSVIENKNRSGSYAIQLLDYLIDRLLLAKNVPFPFPEGLDDPWERAAYRHDEVGSSRSNGE